MKIGDAFVGVGILALAFVVWKYWPKRKTSSENDSSYPQVNSFDGGISDDFIPLVPLGLYDVNQLAYSPQDEGE